MIEHYKKILFYADGSRGEKAALERARRLAIDNGAELVVCDVVAEVSTEDPGLRSSIKKLQASLIRDRGLVLDKLIAELPAVPGKKHGVKRLVIPGKGYAGIIQVAIDQDFDLVVKAADQKTALAAVVFGSDDIRLLHHCPCPVMIIKPARQKKFRRILAAVDPVAHTNPQHQLNTRIMDTAISLAELEMADLYVLHVWELEFEKHRGIDREANNMAAIATAARQGSQRRMDELVEDYTHVPLKDFLIKGKPHKLIPKFIDDNDIDLLVMGTVARSGIPGFIVGNTAERILNNIDCSVLALKPPGWNPQI